MALRGVTGCNAVTDVTGQNYSQKRNSKQRYNIENPVTTDTALQIPPKMFGYISVK
jgi:hypothetical protein